MQYKWPIPVFTLLIPWRNGEWQWAHVAHPFQTDETSTNPEQEVVSDSDIEGSGEWFFDIPEQGFYEVSVSIPSYNATTQKAKYLIYHNGKISDKVIDQNKITGELSKRWVSLGTYYFNNGSNNHVKYAGNRW